MQVMVVTPLVPVPTCATQNAVRPWPDGPMWWDDPHVEPPPCAADAAAAEEEAARAEAPAAALGEEEEEEDLLSLDPSAERLVKDEEDNAPFGDRIFLTLAPTGPGSSSAIEEERRRCGLYPEDEPVFLALAPPKRPRRDRDVQCIGTARCANELGSLRCANVSTAVSGLI